MAKKPRVKICCISSTREAFDAISFGASALGFVGKMPSGPGIISNNKIAEIVGKVPTSIATFLLTSETHYRGIIDHHKKVGTSTIQIVDKIADRDYKRIRDAVPNTKLVQVIHVLDERSIDEALGIVEFVDAVLLDSGNPNLEVKELGGTGRTHNWDLSKRIVEQSDRPVFLAGGLKPENVRRAIETVQPFGLDLCSGVRTEGRLDISKLDRFFTEVGKI